MYYLSHEVYKKYILQVTIIMIFVLKKIEMFACFVIVSIIIIIIIINIYLYYVNFDLLFLDATLFANFSDALGCCNA